MQHHELPNRHTVDLFLELICTLECEGRMGFRDDEDRDRFIRTTLGLLQHDLREAVRHERQVWTQRIEQPSTQ